MSIEKEQRLKKYKRVATGLLVLMIAIFVVTKFMESHYGWLGYIRAFSEAAMVGAFADWFAVVALFRHPMGIPIPHTNLIEKRRLSIGVSLGNFIVKNFLDEETLRREIAKVNLSTQVAHWIQEPVNCSMLANEVQRFIPAMLNGVDAQQINDAIKSKADTFVKNIDFASTLSEILNYITHNNRHQALLTEVANSLSKYIDKNQEWIHREVTQNSSSFIPAIIDRKIANKIVRGVENLLNEIKDNPEHPIRTDFDEFAVVLIDKLKNSEDYRAKVAKLKEDIFRSASFQNYTQNIWGDIKDGLIADLGSEQSKIREQLCKAMTGIGKKIESDPELQQSIDRAIREKILALIVENRDYISEQIGMKVRNWNNISHKFELELGKDLQFIRINGTLVGGTVGLLLYIIFEKIL